MIIIQGESNSGKSRKSIDFIRGKKNCIFLRVDKDDTTLKYLKETKTDFYTMNHCSLLDIKYKVLESGGLMNNDLDYVVIDSINLISDRKSYLEKIKYLLEVERDFNIKLIVTMNILRMLDKIPKSIEGLNDIFIIDLMSQQ